MTPGEISQSQKDNFVLIPLLELSNSETGSETLVTRGQRREGVENGELEFNRGRVSIRGR